MALTVWFYEHTHGNVSAFVYDPSFKLVDKEAFPRVLKWGTRNYKHEGTYKSLLNSLSCLEPLSNEEASYISPLEEGSTLELAAKDRENQQLREYPLPISCVSGVFFSRGLEAVEQALIELVILPLKRPELFAGMLL
ncbi:hypothetical protein H6P81_012555 [Aristolochia fimbriata]|uniref:Uncharacterized protein n=1 Tax=Aristolochia fimbriata TaxID=158543 RepID=A0AAV7EFS8_ARIFI|nr:hypothetical protein H6P81_012555 [Aristolochia fimbriata]